MEGKAQQGADVSYYSISYLFCCQAQNGPGGFALCVVFTRSEVGTHGSGLSRHFQIRAFRFLVESFIGTAFSWAFSPPASVLGGLDVYSLGGITY